MPVHRFVEQAAAGVSTTAGDLGRFAAALTRDARGMAVPAAATGGIDGLGLIISPLDDGSKIVGHDGADPGWRADFAVFPEQGWGSVILTNGDNGQRVINGVLRLLVS